MALGLQCLCVYNILYSFVCMIALATQDPRLLNGGYNRATAFWSGAWGSLGFIFGGIGLVGVSDHRVNWVKTYNYYQYVKCFIAILIFVMDMYVLYNYCDTWISRVESQVNYNPALERVSMNNLCEYTRLAYTTGFMIDFGLNLYYTYIGYVYCERIAHLPPHMIWFTGNKTNKSADFEGFNPGVGEPGKILIKNVSAVKVEERRHEIVSKSMYGAVV
jgi:hypothetical protein